MAEQKQILRISSTDNIRYSVLRLLHECLAAAARKAMPNQLLRCQNTFSRNLMSEICCFM